MKSIRYAKRVKPAPVRSTITLYDATERHPAARGFGQGVLPSRPHYTAPYTAADLDFAAAAFATEEFDCDFPSDEVWDALFDEVDACDRLERGFLPHDSRRGCLDRGSCQGTGLNTMFMGHAAQE